MNNLRQVEFTVLVTIKYDEGKFGVRRQRVGEFCFCAADSGEASKLAAGNCRAMGFEVRRVEDHVYTQIVGAVPV